MSNIFANWYCNHSEVVNLAYWLEENHRFDSIADVCYFIEKPWKWQNEYEEMKDEEENQKLSNVLPLVEIGKK